MSTVNESAEPGTIRPHALCVWKGLNNKKPDVGFQCTAAAVKEAGCSSYAHIYGIENQYFSILVYPFKIDFEGYSISFLGNKNGRLRSLFVFADVFRLKRITAFQKPMSRWLITNWVEE